MKILTCHFLNFIIQLLLVKIPIKSMLNWPLARRFLNSKSDKLNFLKMELFVPQYFKTNVLLKNLIEEKLEILFIKILLGSIFKFPIKSYVKLKSPKTIHFGPKTGIFSDVLCYKNVNNWSRSSKLWNNKFYVSQIKILE